MGDTLIFISMLAHFPHSTLGHYCCPICLNPGAAELYRCHICVRETQFQTYMGGDGTLGQVMEPFWHCDRCGFVFRTGKLSESIESVYSSRPLSQEELRSSIEAHYQDRFASGKIKRLDWLEQHCRFQCVLDVGTGHGELVKILRDRGYQATGIDPDSARIRTANQLWGLAMQSGFYTASAFRADEFDLIIAECVLYRFPHVDVFFHAARKHLRAAGHIFLVLPDLHLAQLPFLTNSVRCLFTPENMEPLLASRGFRLVSVVTSAALPEAFQPGVFGVLAEKADPSSLRYRFVNQPDRWIAYLALLKQDYGLLRSRSVFWPGAVALLKALDDVRWYALGSAYSRGVNLLSRVLSASS